MPDVVELKNIAVSFGQEAVYRNLSFSVADGEFLCILGPSGCGKSTLLRVIGDLLGIDAGAVMVDGHPAAEGWREIAYVFQLPRLLPWRNAVDNVILGRQLRFGRRNKAEMREKAQELLRLVGLGRDMHKLPGMLSGGERQRVAIARALAVDPRIILMDEPFSALDLTTRRRMRAEIIEIWRETGKTIIFVTHEVDEAIELADRIVVLSNKPTTVRAVLPITEPRPRDVRRSPELRAIHQKLAEYLGATADEATAA
jgi:NitT/TauT family transport system ATP-binding protein